MNYNRNLLSPVRFARVGGFENPSIMLSEYKNEVTKLFSSPF